MGWGSGSWWLSLLLCRPLFEGENEFCLYLEELFPNLKVWCTPAVVCPCIVCWSEVVVMGEVVLFDCRQGGFVALSGTSCDGSWGSLEGLIDMTVASHMMVT